ncbi:hypothetical protein HYR99_21915 [Candidatus Poribacteria bacterium]|nr:hypothetical protein [Candidatus Poribacteria bacterium]
MIGYTTKDINEHKQDRHVKGTVDHEIAVKSGKNPSVFPDRKTAEKYVIDTWKTGNPDPNNLNRRVKNYGSGVVGQTHDGKDLHQVTVQDSKTGKHGWPSGKAD